MEMYELMPTDGRKSFYNKAVVKIDDKGRVNLTIKGVSDEEKNQFN